VSNTLRFSIEDDIGVAPDVECFESAIAANQFDAELVSIGVGVSEEGWVDFLFDSTPSANDGATMAAIVAGHALASAKHHKYKSIDKATDALVSAGFSFAGKQFSLSANARQRIIAVDLMRNDPAIAYPVNWNTIDDADSLPIADSEMMHGMALTAMGTVRAYIDMGSAAKAQVRLATTVEEVESVTL